MSSKLEVPRNINLFKSAIVATGTVALSATLSIMPSNSENTQESNPTVAHGVETDQGVLDHQQEVLLQKRAMFSTSRSVVRKPLQSAQPRQEVYCWDGKRQFSINNAKDKVRRNIGISCLQAAKQDWYTPTSYKAQVQCMVRLFTKESRYDETARNESGAYGIPQALPGNKMASAGSDWRTNPATQIEWGLHYIDKRYGTPCGAWDHSKREGWY